MLRFFQIVMFTGGIAFLSLAGTLTLARQQPAQAPFIAFQSFREGNWNIYRMRAEGGWFQQLTFSERNEQFPSWSVDGRWIAFSAFAEGEFHIYRVRSGGGDIQQVTPNGISAQLPAFSPDGNWLGFVGDNGGGQDIYLMSTDQRIQQLTDHGEIDSFFSWSPDSQWIVFTSRHEGNAELYRIRTDGTGEERLTHDPWQEWGAVWSPDGQWIGFTADGGSNYELYRLSVKSGETERLTNTAWDELLGSWSPDGRWMVYAAWRNTTNLELYLSRPDGSEPRQITFAKDSDWVPVWSPIIDMAWRSWVFWGLGGLMTMGTIVIRQLYRPLRSARPSPTT